MDWRVLVVIIVVGLFILIVVILGMLLQRALRRQDDLNLQIELWKGRCKTSKEEVKRLLNLMKAGELTDEEAIKKANKLLADWNAVNSDSTPDSS